MVSRAAVEAKVRRQAAELARSTHGYVATPAGLAEELTHWPYSALGDPGQPRVLDPSAGIGALVEAVLDQDRDAQVVAVEPDEGRRHDLIKLAPGWSGLPAVFAGTFEEYTAAHPGVRFDAVLMNPPWSVPGRPRLWVEHILAAWGLLHPGGRLVAVTPDADPGGPCGGRLRALIEAYGGTDPVNVDRVAVRGGFPATVRVVWLAAPMLTASGLPSWLLNPAPGVPVAVDELDVTPHAAAATPVQAYADRFDGYRLRVVRYAGTCVTCARLLWAHDDGAEGSVSWAACSCLEAEAYCAVGLTVGLCMECRHTRYRYERALELARLHWTPRGVV